MDYDYKELVNNFKLDPSTAIQKCQEIICSVSNFDSYKDFYSYHLKNAHITTCQKEWTTTSLSIFCKNCSLNKNSCICLSCFLNGNHEGHEYTVNNKSVGNCDCGDFSLWKSSGFSSNHHGIDEQDKNPQDYLDQNLQTLLTDVIFKAAFSSLSNFTNDNTENAISIIQFISSFLKFGDGFRRLIAISLTEKIDIQSLMEGIVNYSKEFNQSFQKLCGGLINDQLFLRNFSNIVYHVLYTSILKDTKNYMSLGSEKVSYNIWNKFWFHFYNEKIIEYNIIQKKINWVDFFCAHLSCLKELYSFVSTGNFKEIPSSLSLIFYSFFKVTKILPNEETQLLFDKMVEQVTCNETKNDNIIVTSFKDYTESLVYKPIYYFNSLFSIVFYSFENKPNLKYDKLFEALDKNLDINPIFYAGVNPVGCENGENNDNDLFIANLLNQDEFSEPF